MRGEARRDIQLLRGIAVLVVVLFHSDTSIFTRGFLGVDVFFVVSGFLITSIILQGLDERSFRFSDFYLRRAKRLLPALYSTLIATTLLAYLFVTPSQLQDYIDQLIGAVSFSSNMVLPTQVGYFENDAGGKPLLHIWSLSLEEQYYFTLPLLLFLLPSATRLYALIGLALLSFGWCLSWSSAPDGPPPLLWRIADSSRGEWVFYLFPTRAWELLAGSLCAWIMRYRQVRIPAAVKGASLLLILLLANVGIDAPHPRGDALLVVLATCLILLGSGAWLPQLRVLRALERIGDWSYSVYLLHWPLFAFAFLGYAGAVPLTIKLLLVGLSLLLGYLQYRYVETPFRYGWQARARPTWARFALASGLVLVLPIPLAFGGFTHQSADYGYLRRANVGLSAQCDRWGIDGRVAARCQTDPHPRVAVWGDSYAMHLVPGLLTGNPKLMQLTKSVCGPLLGIAPVDDRYQADWASACIAYNQRALEAIISNPQLTHVVLSSSFERYFGARAQRFLLDGVLVAGNPQAAEARLIASINTLIANGKVPVIYAPPPRAGFNVGECLEREATARVLFRAGCNIDAAAYQAHDRAVIQSLQRVGRVTGVEVKWIADLLCDAALCRTTMDGVHLYRDVGHLSITGSQKLLARIQVDTRGIEPER